MPNFLLMPNLNMPEAVTFAETLADFLSQRGQSAFVLEKMYRGRETAIARISADALPEDTMVISLGGDGTLLHNVRALGRFDLPVFCINYGHLGFLTVCAPASTFPRMEKILSGAYRIIPRLVLEGEILHTDGTEEKFFAINEAVLTRGTYTRALRLTVSVEDDVMEPFSADGVLVATPTGSTAYNLAAGGPVMLPTANVFAVNPICSHALTNRALVISGDDEVSIRVHIPSKEEPDAATHLVTDSCEKYPLADGDLLRFRKAPFVLKTPELHNAGFMKTLHEKLTRFL